MPDEIVPTSELEHVAQDIERAARWIAERFKVDPDLLTKPMDI